MSANDTDWWTRRAADMAAIDPAFAGEIDRLAEDQVDLLERALSLQTGDRVLDLGCGAGRHAILLHERGYPATGVDLSDPVLELARGAWERRHGEEPGPSWVQGDMREPSVSGSFDVVLLMDCAFGVFADDAEHLAVLGVAAERLGAEGQLLLELPNPYFWAQHQHTRHYPPGALSADAHIIRTYRFDAETGRVEDHLTVFGEHGSPRVLPVQSLRAWAPTEIRALVAASGFRDVRVLGMDGWRVPDEPRALDPARSAFMWVLART